MIGPNGAGKTTLIKTLIGREKPDAGEVKLGHKVQVGYHDQGLQSLDPDTTVVRAVWPEDDPEWVEGDVRDLLARFGLTGEIVFQTVGQLSGGEKAKAALARLCATAANLLVMDEPTNHLDIWSREALERSINEFEGTVLVVSHDRYFLNQVADRLDRDRRRPGPRHRGRLRDLPAPRPEGEGTRREGQLRQCSDRRLRRDAGPAPRHRPRSPSESSPTARPPRSSARSASSRQEVAELEDLLGQPATWRDPVKAVGTQDRHRDLKTQAGNPLPALGDRARSQLVSRSNHARCHPQSPDHHPPRDRADARRPPAARAASSPLERAAEVMVVGDLHGNLPAFKKVLALAALDRIPERHLVLQELIHGPLMYPDDKGDRSHQLLDVVAALKCQYPERVHLILGNHELSELTGRIIGKDGETLNADVPQGITTAYGALGGRDL